MKARAVFLLLCCIWGSTWLFIKLGLRDLPPVSFAAVRFLLASVILFAIVAVRRMRLPRSGPEWALIAQTGVLAFALNYGLLFWGEQHISPGLAALFFVGLAVEGNPLTVRWTTLAVVSLLYLTFVGSVAAFLLYYWLVRNMDVTKTMLIALVTPLAAVLLGMAVLGERLTWRTVAGGALIMSGIGMVVLRRARRAGRKTEAVVAEG